MPEKVLPTLEDFLEFQKKMTGLGFKKIGKKQFTNDFYRLELSAPRHRPGREAGFEYFANNLRVKVWTTFVEDWQEAKPVDYGWVLITKGDDAQYFAHPKLRTTNFFANLFLTAKACMERIEHRPCCEDKRCRRMLTITPSRGGGRYWRCDNVELHGRALPKADWDTGLSNESLIYVKEQRKLKARYRKKRIAEGKSVGMAKIIRKKWTIGMPQNKE